MSYCLFLEPAQPGIDDISNLIDAILDAIGKITIPGIKAIEFFTPVRSHDPFLDDGAGPEVVFQFTFSTPDSLRDVFSCDAFQQLSAVVHASGQNWLYQVWRMEDYPLEKKAAPPDAVANVSYLVNYHRPAEDETEFLAYYRSHHPPIMKRFPGLLRLRLGLPLHWRPQTSLNDADRMLFCEVSFAGISELDNALASEIRKELRRDYVAFPSFSGPVTHFAMQRQSLFQR